MIVVDFKSVNSMNRELIDAVRQINGDLADYMESLTDLEVVESGFDPMSMSFRCAFSWSDIPEGICNIPSYVFRNLPTKFQ